MRGLFGNSYIGSLGLTLATNILIAGLSLIAGVISARLLGPSGRGELAAIQTIPTILADIALLGIPEALIYFSARQPNESGNMLTTSILLALLFCIPFMLVGNYIIPMFLASQSIDIVNGAQNYLWLLPINATAGILVHALRGKSEIPSWNLARTFPTILWVVIIIYVFVLGITKVTFITNWYLIGLALLFIPTGLILRSKISGNYHPLWVYAGQFIKYGAPVAISTIPFWFNSKLYQILMASWFDPKTLGLYVVAISWSNVITPLASVLPSVMLPYVSKMINTDQQYSALSFNTRLAGLISILLSLFMTLLAPLLIPLLFGKNFSSIIPVAMILSIAAGFISFNRVLETGALSLGKPIIILIAESIGLGITGILLLLLLKPLRLYGAAIATMISCVVITLVLIYSIAGHTLIPKRKLIFLQKSDFELLSSWFISLRG